MLPRASVRPGQREARPGKFTSFGPRPGHRPDICIFNRPGHNRARPGPAHSLKSLGYSAKIWYFGVRELLYSPFPYSAIYIILAFLFESWYFGHLPWSICLVTCVTLLMVTSSLVTCHCHIVTQAYHYGCASIWPSSASWSVWLTASWWYDSARLCSYQYISRATLYIR